MFVRSLISPQSESILVRPGISQLGHPTLQFRQAALPQRSSAAVATRYFVTMRFVAGGGSAAGEMTNVSQVFQPDGRAEAPNSP
jgi:hypothetical protein